MGHPRGFGFVYQMPRPTLTAEDRSVPLVTLNSLLRRSSTSVGDGGSDPNLKQPLLGDKYRLAFALADFVLDFHTIGWLHENLHPNNVVFFESLPEGRGINSGNSKIITDPHILGLHKSRPGGERWHTQGPVQESNFPDHAHPDYAVTRHFRCGYDYYSLGVVLLEVGLWTPLVAWSSKNRGLSPHEFRDVLVKTYVPRLGPRMGSLYQDVVEKLLTDRLDSFPEHRRPDPENESQVFNRFLDEVMEPLWALSDTPL